MNVRLQNYAQWSGTLIRVVMGGLFIYMGMSKALDPVGFLKLMRQYDLPFSHWLLNSVAASLPWFEVFCGVLLVTGVAVRGTSLLVAMMTIPFTVVVVLRAMEMAGAQKIAFCSVHFDCGCGAGEVYICAKILENVLLTLGAMLLFMGYGKRVAWRYGFGRAGRDES